MEWSKYNHLFFSKKSNSYLLYSAISNMLIELDEEDYQYLLQIKENPTILDLTQENDKLLYNGRFFVDSNETEKNKILLSTLIKRYDNTRLSLTIAPTRGCNFDCIYCYETDRPNITMSQKVQNGVIDFIQKQKQIKNLGVCWYGGEPTLAIPIIRSMSKQMIKLVEDYSAVIVTNGYYIDKIIDELYDLKIQALQITLDGMPDTHNSRRMLKNGGKTFEKIFSNLSALSKKDNINVTVRMNVDDSNAMEYIKLYRYCKQNLNGKINLYPGFVHNSSGVCKVESCYDDCLKKAAFLKKIFDSDFIYTSDIYPFRTEKMCICNMRNGYLIGTEGELYKCWHHLGQKNKEIGTIFADKIITNGNNFANAMLGQDCLFDNKCTDCLLFPSCSCGCPDMRQQEINQCIPAKSMLEDFIEIHYLVKTTQQTKEK